MSAKTDVTRMLNELAGGNSGVANDLWRLVYAELRRLAEQYLRHESAGHTLQTTALVHEAYLKLHNGRTMNWQDRGHFFAVAAQAMRRILIDHARRAAAAKRGGGLVRLDLSDDDLLLQEAESQLSADSDDLVALDDALNDLAGFDPELSRIVELRFFGGLTVEETASVLGVAPITVQRRWKMARGWLHREITGERA
jgi:RNA polymerase sigma factor (TIGR02999 family)